MYFQNYQTIQNQLFPGQSTPTPTGSSLFGASPTGGQGAFGLVPGAINPPAAAERSINFDLNGLVSPEIQQRLQNEAAKFGVSSGMPGSGLATNRYLHDYLGAGEAARDRGFKHYGELLPLAERNAELAAAPDPTQRGQMEQSFAQQMFDRYLAATRGGGNTGGGGGNQSGAAPVGAPAGARPGSFSSPSPFTSQPAAGPSPQAGLTPPAGPWGPQAYPPYPSDDSTMYPNTVTTADSSYYDPYAGFGYNVTPQPTVDFNQSNYDPLADLGLD